MSRPDLSPGEWAVLALVGEGPTHGWEVARALAPAGAVGQVWTFARPLVYRALDTLVAAGLVEEGGSEESSRGPRRTIVRITGTGEARIAAWLGEPAAHVRDARSLLLLKLLFCRRSGVDPRPLLSRQRDALAAAEAQLLHRLAALPGEAGTDRMLVAFRLETTRAVARFVDAELAGRP